MAVSEDEEGKEGDERRKGMSECAQLYFLTSSRISPCVATSQVATQFTLCPYVQYR